MFSAIPKIKGMVDFSQNRIKGIILNKTNEKIYSMLKEKIKEYIDIEVLGYLPKDEDFIIEERYLGLLQTHENMDLDHKLNIISSKIEETININRLIDLAKDIKIDSFKYPPKRNISIGIAYDEAFNFYYEENLKLLESIGNVVYFSPLHDKSLPKVDLIYRESYPELYKEELSRNKNMIEEIKKFAKNKGYIYGEGGGLMYLVETIENIPMCGLLKGKGIMTKRLQRFGYVNIRLKEDCLLGVKGDNIVGQEFHRSIVETTEKEIFEITKPKTNRNWECGYMKDNILVAYSHINFLGNKKVLNYLIDKVENKR